MRILAGFAALGIICGGAALAGSDPAAGAATGPTAGKGAAWPKGHYDALDALPDWGGVWVLNRTRRAPGDPAPEQPVLKGPYLERYQAWQKEVRENNGVARRDTSNCMPPGMPNMMGTAQYPIEFLFTPGRVTTHHEAWMQWRSIYTDGRGHPEDLEPAVFGHSIGRWEGDTLVVETIGIKTITELSAGMKHSPKLKVIERIRLDPANSDQLLVDMTIEDPEALEKPWNRKFSFTRQRDWSLIEFICAENDRNPVNAEGHTEYH
jgi:hypothetical protein